MALLLPAGGPGPTSANNKNGGRKTSRNADRIENGGERRQTSETDALTTNQGIPVSDIAPKIGGVVRGDKKPLLADGQLAGSPSVLFNAVILAPGAGGGAQLAKESAAIDFVRDAFGHLKVIGFGDDAAPLLAAAGVSGKEDEGLVGMAGRGGPAAFVAAAKKHRVWAREPRVRTIL